MLQSSKKAYIIGILTVKVEADIMQEKNFILITDTHFFKNSLGAYGDGYEAFMEREQKCFAETEAINRAAFKFLENCDFSDTVLIAGDLTFNGEKESHYEFVKLLESLRNSGKKIYVVTAAHDISPNPFCFPGSDDKMPAKGIKFDDLYGLYHAYGYDDAIAFNKDHMSYVAQISDGVRLLVLCNDTAEGRSLAYDDEFCGWIKEQLDKAKADGQLIFAMEHYPVLAGQPILSLIKDARQKEAQKLIDLLADNGCSLIFTGHMHNQSINVVETEKGNKFYDVCTGSLIGCPAFMRFCTVKDEKTIEIKSVPVPDFEWNTKGKTCEEYLQAQFDSMILNLLIGLRDDPPRTMRKIGMKPNPALVKVFGKLGKGICNSSVGKAAKFFHVKAEPEIKDMPLLDLLTNVVRYVFCGDQPYTDKTPEGRVLLAIVKKLSPVIRIANKKLHGSQGEQLDLYEIIKHSFGNYGIPDNNATIILK